MENQLFKLFKKCFNLACFLTAFYFIVSCTHQFLLNKDTSFITYKEFHVDENRLYPSVSLCFLNDILLYESDYNKCFLNFLGGKYEKKDGTPCTWNSSYADKDYDSITKNFIQYVIGEVTAFEDGTKCNYPYKMVLNGARNNKEPFCNHSKPRVYISSRRGDEKCVTFDIPFKKGTRVRTHAILLNNSVFDDRRRPKHGFVVSFHYPNQILRATSKKYTWKKDTALLNTSCELGDDDEDDAFCQTYQNQTYSMIFDIDNVSVLRRRNKPQNPCIANWKNDDLELRSIISKDQLCKPNHWNISLNLKKCKSKEDFENTSAKEKRPTIHSCNKIEKLNFMYTEVGGLTAMNLDKKEFNVIFGVEWEAKEMKHEIISEILVDFIGKNNFLHEIY